MRKLVNGLTAFSLLLVPNSCATPGEKDQAPSPSPSVTRLLPSICGFHSYDLENAREKSREKACEVAQKIGNAILEGKPVLYANDYVWFDQSSTRPGCILQPLVYEVDGQGYIISVREKGNDPQLVIYGLPGELPDNLDIQHDPILTGEYEYVSVIDGEQVGRSRPDMNNFCKQGFAPQ